MADDKYSLTTVIFDGQSIVRNCAGDLRSMARAMERVGSQACAEELRDIADTIEAAVKAIRDAHGEHVHAEYAESMAGVGRILTALCANPEANHG